MKKIFTIIALVLVCLTSNAKKVDYTSIDEVIAKVVLSTTDIKVDTVIVLNNKEVKIDAYHNHINGYLLTVNVYTDSKAIRNHCCKVFKDLGFEKYSDYNNFHSVARLHTSKFIEYIELPIEFEISHIRERLFWIEHNMRYYYSISRTR